MRRIICILPFLLLLSLFVNTLHAQHHRTRAVSAAPNAAIYQQKSQQKEADLNRIKLTYDAMEGAEKDAAKAEMLATLYELFDLSILKREAQAQQLRTQLRNLSENPAYQNHTGDISQLKVKLAQVEAQIKQRKAYRDEIVARRLAELM